MSEQITPVPESMLAREIFGPLGGIVEIGAVVATGRWAVADASVGDLVRRRQGEVDRLLSAIRAIGGFSDAAMAIADELGYLRDHQVTAPSLLLWSGCIEEISPRLEELEHPMAVRRMCHMGADLQLAILLQALLTAAIAERAEAPQGAERVAAALALAVSLADDAGRSNVADTFKMWRVAFLPAILRPDSTAPEYGKRAFRAYAHILEALTARNA